MELVSSAGQSYNLESGIPSSGREAGFGTRLMTPASPQEREQISQEYLEINYGHDSWLRRHGYDPIIDASFGPRLRVDLLDAKQYNHRAGALRAKMDEAKLRRFPPEFEVAYTSLLAIETMNHDKFIRDDGQKTPFPEYYAKISGDVLTPMSREDLEKPRDEFLSLLSAQGYRFDPRDNESVREAYQRYHLTRRPTNRVVLDHQFGNYDRGQRHHLAEELGRPEIEDLNYTLRWKRGGTTWMCWEKVEEGRFIVDMNEANFKYWNWGMVERYPLHEVNGHLVKLYLIGQQIAKGELDKIMSISLIPTPASWIDEGHAQTIDTYGEFRLTPDGKLSVAQYRMYKRALSQAVYEREIEGKDKDEVVSRMVWFTPHKTNEEVNAEINEIEGDEMWRAYGATYGRADKDLMELASRLGSGKRDVLQLLSTRPMTRSQFISTPIGALID